MRKHTNDAVSAQLSQLPTPNTSHYKPHIYSASDQVALIELLKKSQPTFHDELESQLMELMKIRNPSEKLDQGQLRQRMYDWLDGKSLSEYGLYVYYPWSNRLVHLVGKEEFIELRTSRNKLKITEQEQKRLSRTTIGIIGLSVGQSVALTIASERIAGNLRLADFDNLELTNLNRIRSGVHSLGLSKAVVAAREIAELDPFINVEIFQEGVTEQNIDEFFHAGTSIDLLVEVCDSLPIKILSRLKARHDGVPVLMDTSDRGMFDVERFDREPERDIFHGKCAISDLHELEALDEAGRMQLLLKIVDFDRLSDKMKMSFAEVGKSLTTWPQLASDVVAGGAVTAKVARKILLGENVDSGRYYFDHADKMQDQSR